MALLIDISEKLTLFHDGKHDLFNDLDFHKLYKTVLNKVLFYGCEQACELTNPKPDCLAKIYSENVSYMITFNITILNLKFELDQCQDNEYIINKVLKEKTI